MKLLHTLVFIFIICFVNAQEPFITQWKTNHPGVTDNFSIQIPLAEESTYDFEVQWGDGNIDTYTGLGAELTAMHTYADSGIYEVSIGGEFPRIIFEYQNDREKIIDIIQWGDIDWENFNSAFMGCINLEVNASDAPDLSNVTNMASMFGGCESFNQSVENWDVSNIENMVGLFAGASSFNQPLEAWNVSAVTDMRNMFYGAYSFNQFLETWNVSTVTNMREMFTGAAVFNQPMETWDVSGVTDMTAMFSNALNFNQPIGGWDVSNVASTVQMFENASAFNQPLNSWTLPSDVQLNYMFLGATSFNQPLDLWDVSNVTSLGAIFRDAINFNQPLNTWDVSSATSLASLFRGATSFNQSLSSWDISNVETMQNMLMNSGMSACNYDSMLNAWAALNPQLFVELGSGGIQYTEAGAAARQALMDNYLWIISGDELVELTELVIGSEVNGTNINISASGGTGAYTFNWTGPNGFTSSDSSIVAPYNGTYTVIVSDGCEEWTDSFEIISVGISEIDASGIQVFPNPASQNVEIYTSNPHASILHLYDPRGILVTEVPFNSNWVSIDLIGYNAGVYMVRISDRHGTILEYERVAVVH